LLGILGLGKELSVCADAATIETAIKVKVWILIVNIRLIIIIGF
jgi:hypothetical protein